MTAIGAHLPVLELLENTGGNSAYCSKRVFPVVLPQNVTLPAETFQIISAPREHAMGTDPGTVHARVQVDIYDSTYLGTVSGGKHVRTAMSRYTGTPADVTVHAVFVDNEREAYLESLEGGKRKAWRRTLDFIMHYEE